MNTSSHDERIRSMTFASVYPHYITKVEKKWRTREELDAIICWLLGFSAGQLQNAITQNRTFEEVFAQAVLPPEAELITGTICGYKISEIQNPLTKKVRYLDKIVDELAKGKTIEKIQRKI